MDVAFLLGARAKTKVSRYERGRHLPTLATALAYEALLGLPVAELFPSAFAAARRDVLRRAKVRAKLLATLPQGARNARRKRSVEALFV
jgi:transcriptional regulator with XRE-family HTH domain